MPASTATRATTRPRTSSSCTPRATRAARRRTSDSPARPWGGTPPRPLSRPPGLALGVRASVFSHGDLRLNFGSCQPVGWRQPTPAGVRSRQSASGARHGREALTRNGRPVAVPLGLRSADRLVVGLASLDLLSAVRPVDEIMLHLDPPLFVDPVSPYPRSASASGRGLGSEACRRRNCRPGRGPTTGVSAAAGCGSSKASAIRTRPTRRRTSRGARQSSTGRRGASPRVAHGGVPTARASLRGRTSPRVPRPTRRVGFSLMAAADSPAAVALRP